MRRAKINRPSRPGQSGPAPRVDILVLDPVERAALKRGQRVTAGPDNGYNPVGTFIAEGPGSTVVLWDGSPSEIVTGS